MEDFPKAMDQVSNALHRIEKERRAVWAGKLKRAVTGARQHDNQKLFR